MGPRFEDFQAAAERLSGSCDSGAHEAEALGIDLSELENKMLDFNVEICPGCGYWVESDELVDENNDPQECTNCVV